MTRLLIYLLLFGVILYMVSLWNRTKGGTQEVSAGEARPRRFFRPKKNPREVWAQVYETETLDEARILQAQLQEHEIDCVVYEQGKKDIHGNALKGVGVAVPKSSMGNAQGIISRMPV